MVGSTKFNILRINYLHIKIEIYKIYADDGYFGANFNRPSFKEMIRDIEDGKINLVIVKDLSRFNIIKNKKENKKI